MAIKNRSTKKKNFVACIRNTTLLNKYYMESSSQLEVTNAKNVVSTSVTTTTNNTSVASYKTAVAEEDLLTKNRSNNTFLEQQPKAQGKVLNEKLVFKTDTEEYEVNQIIGKGSFGTVYKAIRCRDGLECALKMVKISSMKEFDAAKTEFEIMKQLDHPHIVRTYDSFCIELDQALHMCIVQEFCNLDTLDHLLRSKPMARTIQNNIDFLIQWMLDLLDTLAYMHSKSIIHRDLKPGNIFLSLQIRKELDDTNTLLSFATKVGDFGVSTENSRNAQLTAFSGTPLFMPKEMIQREAYNATVDVYAMGLIFVQMTLGISTEELAKKVGVFSKLSQEVRLEALEKVIKDPSVFYIISQMVKDKTFRKESWQLLQDPVINSLRHLQSIENYVTQQQSTSPNLSRGDANVVVAFITGLSFQSIKTKVAAIEHLYYYLFDFENREATLQLFLKGKGYFYLVKALDKILNLSDMSQPSIQATIQQSMKIIHLCLSESTNHSLFASLRRSSIFSLLNRVYHFIDVTLCLEILVFLGEKTCTNTMSQLIFQQNRYLRMIETIIQEELVNGTQFLTPRGIAAQNWIAVMGKHFPSNQLQEFSWTGKITSGTMSRILFSIPPTQREYLVITAIHFFLNQIRELLSQNLEEEEISVGIQNALHGILCYVENHQASLIRSSLFHTCETVPLSSHTNQMIRYSHFFYKCLTCNNSSNSSTAQLICPTCSISCHKEHKLVPVGYLIDGICNCDDKKTCVCNKEVSLMKDIKDERLFFYENRTRLERATIQLRDLDTPIDLQIEITINGPIIKYSSHEKLVEYQLPASIMTLQPICSPVFDEQELSTNQTWNQTVGNLNVGETLAYFEVSIVCGGWIDAIGVGVTQDPKYPTTSFPGFKSHSIGFSGDDGNLVFCQQENQYVRIPYFQTFGSGDVVGCGVTIHGYIYYTLNGRFISVIENYRLQNNQPVHAVFGLKGNQTEIHVNFGRKQFLFDFAKLQQYLQHTSDEYSIIGSSFAKEAFVASNGVEILNNLSTQWNHDSILTHLVTRVSECVQISIPPNSKAKKVFYQNTKYLALQTGALNAQPISKAIVDNKTVAFPALITNTRHILKSSTEKNEEETVERASGIVVTEPVVDSQKSKKKKKLQKRTTLLLNIIYSIPEIILLVISMSLLISQCIVTWLDYDQVQIDTFIFIVISLSALLLSIVLDTIVLVSSTIITSRKTTLYNIPCTIIAFLSLTLQHISIPIHFVTCAVRYRQLYYTIFRLEFFSSLNFAALLIWSLYFIKSCLQLLHVLNRMNYPSRQTISSVAIRAHASTQVIVYFLLCALFYITRFIVIVVAYIPPNETFSDIGYLFFNVYSLNEYLVTRIPYGYIAVIFQTIFAWGYFFIYWGTNLCCCLKSYYSCGLLTFWNLYSWLYVFVIGLVPLLLFLNDFTVLMNRMANETFTVLVGYIFRIAFGVFIFGTPCIVSCMVCIGYCMIRKQGKDPSQYPKSTSSYLETTNTTEIAQHAPGAPPPALIFSPASPITQQLLHPQEVELPSVFLSPNNLTGFGQN